MRKYIISIAALCLLAYMAVGQTPELVTAAGSANLAAANGKLFFTGSDTLWVSDGTSAGTQPLIEIPANGGAAQFTEGANGKTFLRFPDSNGDPELWITDGTPAGTVLVKDINSAGTGCVLILRVFNNKLYFIGDDGVNGTELWMSDGTASGTTMVKNIFSGNSNGVPTWTNTYVYSGRLYFSADDGTNGEELWATDGTEAGTVMVKNIHSGGSSSPGGFREMNGKLYFMATANNLGSELWVTDGTDAGTTLVKDINPGIGNAFPGVGTVFNNKLYFTVSAAFNLDEPYDLWVSDGTEAGTVVFEDSVLSPYVYNGQLYFGKITGYTAPFFEYALYKTDGTQQGMVKVKDLDGGNSKRPPGLHTPAGGKLYFLCNYDGPGGGANYLAHDLWVTDGTTANTQLIRHGSGDLVNVFLSGTDMVQLNGSLFFASAGSLYKIAGTNVGINDPAEKTDVLLYPNPANEMLNIVSVQPIESVSIFNAMGALVQTESQPKFSIAQLATGVYLVYIKTSNGIIRTRLVKE